MIKRTVHIDRLRIRFRGVSLTSVRSAAEGLGGEVLDRLTGIAASGEIDSVMTDVIKLPDSATPSTIRRCAADSVAAGILNRKEA